MCLSSDRSIYSLCSCYKRKTSKLVVLSSIFTLYGESQRSAKNISVLQQQFIHEYKPNLSLLFCIHSVFLVFSFFCDQFDCFGGLCRRGPWCIKWNATRLFPKTVFSVLFFLLLVSFLLSHTPPRRRRQRNSIEACWIFFFGRFCGIVRIHPFDTKTILHGRQYFYFYIIASAIAIIKQLFRGIEYTLFVRNQKFYINIGTFQRSSRTS